MHFLNFAIISLIIIWIASRWYLRAYLRLAFKIPSNKWHTFFGWGKIIKRKDAISYVYGFLKKYGPNCIGWLGPLPIFLTTEPQILKDILTSKQCINKPKLLYGGIIKTAGDGLITLNDPNWSQHRKILNRAFSHKMLISYLPIFQHEVNRLIEKINEDLKKGEENIDMFMNLRELTLRNSQKTILKRDLKHASYNVVHLLKLFHDILDYAAETCINPILKISLLLKLAQKSIFKTAFMGMKELKGIIKDSINILHTNDINDPSYCPNLIGVVDYTIQGMNQQAWQLNEAAGELLQLFAAAFESSTSTLFMVLCLLAMHKEYQERAYEEVISVLPVDDEEEITMEHLDKLVYLEMIFNETLRIFPIVPIVFRQVTDKDLLLSNGITLPMGQIIGIDIYSLHRNTDIWGPQAHIFNPDNFLPCNFDSKHPYAYLPFTKGQRFCIGWRYAILFEKLTLAKLIKTYKYSTDFIYEDLKFINHLSLKFEKEPKLILESRKN